ncbi:hypothetical protein, unknown function [Leishmania tarentolae]|uniref:Uncharacterized protein n=1 Tax=Leishmania tarentolae TaxID=5689 RepID=A0A640KH64_LEITA|nr:hypothetical protein, unknown function [Leishmania tarentolae]
MMHKPSPRQSTRRSSRSPMKHNGVSAAGSHALLSSDPDTPPPPSRRLRSRSTPFQTTPLPPALPPTTGICISVVSAQPCMRGKPALQRCTTMSVCKTSAETVVAPQSSRVLSSIELRKSRDPVSKGHSASNSREATVRRRSKMRSSSRAVASARSGAITTAAPIASQSSFRISSDSSMNEVMRATTHPAPRHQRETLGSPPVEKLLVSPVPEPLSESFEPHTPLFARREVARSMQGVAVAGCTSMSGHEPGSAVATFPHILNGTHSSTLSSLTEAAATSVEGYAVVHLEALPESCSTTTSAEQHDECTLGHRSNSHLFSRSMPLQEPATSLTSLWSPHMQPCAKSRRSTMSVMSANGASGSPGMMDTPVPPQTGSCVTWAPVCNAGDLSESTTTAHPNSVSNELKPCHPSSLLVCDAPHHSPSCMGSASQGTESDEGVPAQINTHALSAPLLSSNLVAEPPSSPPLRASAHVASDVVHITHTPEQHRLRLAPSSGYPGKTLIPSHRISATSAGTNRAPVRPPLMRDGASCGSGSRMALSGRDFSTRTSHSPHPARPQCASPSRTPRLVSNSSDRQRPLTPTMSAPGAANTVFSGLTKSPVGMLSAEMAKRAVKDRRRRELYAWNDHLRLQSGSSVQDAV